MIGLAVAIALGVAAGRELSRWIGLLTAPLRQPIEAWLHRRWERLYDDGPIGGPDA